MWLWKNWEILALSTKAKESGGVGLRSRAASEHLMDAKNQREGKEKQAGDTWGPLTKQAQRGPLTKQAQSLIANEFTHVNNYLEWVLTKERSGTRIEGPTEWDFLAWLFHFFQCRSVSYNFSNPPQSLAWKMWSHTGERGKNGPQDHAWVMLSTSSRTAIPGVSRFPLLWLLRM